jgi:hypothetical protein
VSPAREPDSKTVVILFAAGAALVVAAFTYALVRQWRTFDPLVTASAIGVGLLLIVIYDRLGHMYSELRTITQQLERLNGGPVSAQPVNTRDRESTESARHATEQGQAGVGQRKSLQ